MLARTLLLVALVGCNAPPVPHYDVTTTIADAGQGETYSAIRLGSNNAPTQAFNLAQQSWYIVFMQGGRERLRIEPDGGFFVDGRHVTDDLEIYSAVSATFAGCGCDAGKR